MLLYLYVCNSNVAGLQPGRGGGGKNYQKKQKNSKVGSLNQLAIIFLNYFGHIMSEFFLFCLILLGESFRVWFLPFARSQFYNCLISTPPAPARMVKGEGNTTRKYNRKNSQVGILNQLEIIFRHYLAVLCEILFWFV